MTYGKVVPFESLKDETIVDIIVKEDSITFICAEGTTYLMHHHQDCCEWVSIEDINGDIKKLIGNKIVLAEEISNSEIDEGPLDKGEESYTWTFYKIADDKGNYVTVRWYGSSNGYYSESVDFERIDSN